ncbi:MAG: urease accessory protein [Gammaproteobacteria bacterium]|nr:MAG: urease accessory protein [Gammaproteobacteria bacterium]TND02107.1 MAG: urease accessory protein [Gammaproteobacteria bacterium]
MLQLTHRLSEPVRPTLSLTAPFELRQKSRARVCLDDGTEAAWLLPRGTVLRDGDLLQGDDADDSVVGVIAAPEPVSTVLAADPLLLARAAYHLGNRHVALQIGNGWLRYQRDHVLDAMVRELGLQVVNELTPFEPEAGAYHSHG